MPDEHGIPTDEEIEKWRERWTDERVANVVSILQEDPEWGAKKIVELSWYTKENGFERWPEYERMLEETNYKGIPVIDFRGCIFPSQALLNGVVLPCSHFEEAYLDRAYLSIATLWNANLSGTRLSQVIFKDVNLHMANLSRAYLFNADLSRADLSMADLSLTDLSYADLSGASLAMANVFRADLSSSNLSRAFLNNTNLIKAKLSGTRFIDCYLHGADFRSSQGFAEFDVDTSFRRTIGIGDKNTTWLFDEHVLNKQEIVPKFAMNICSEIRLCFRDNGLFHESAIYYEQEEYWRTRAYFRGRFRDKIRGFGRWLFLERTIGYGEKLGRIIRLSIYTILACAILFFIFGFRFETSSGVFEPMKFSDFVFLSGEAWTYLWKCLLFSIENFTTLGFSIMRPAECNHWLASLEGVVGVLFVALATVTWARKAIRD